MVPENFPEKHHFLDNTSHLNEITEPPQLNLLRDCGSLEK